MIICEDYYYSYFHKYKNTTYTVAQVTESYCLDQTQNQH